MKSIRRFLFWSGVIILCLYSNSQPVLAHETWFVESSPYPPQFQLLFTWPVLLMTALAFIPLGLLLFLRILVKGDNLFPRIGFLNYYDRSNQIIVAVQTAISLIAVAVGLRIFAPNLVLKTTPLGFALAAAQIFVAFTFISGVLTRIGAMVLLGCFFISFFLYPFWSVFEQTLYVGIALYLLIMGRGLVKPTPHIEPLRFFGRYWPYAPLCLRIGVGISIVVLAFTEKLINPDLAQAFLREYPSFNIFQLLGLTWFTNDRYILLAGCIELAIGIALLSGVLPKVVIFGMFVPFNAALPFLPPSELLGHLPIFAAMYVLLFLPPPQELEYMVAGRKPLNPPQTPQKASLVTRVAKSSSLSSQSSPQIPSRPCSCVNQLLIRLQLSQQKTDNNRGKFQSYCKIYMCTLPSIQITE